MKTNLLQENKAVSDELGIPRFLRNARQRNYYPFHLRRCTRYLQWVLMLNILLIFVILFLFFASPTPRYYLTAFDGKITQISPVAFSQASAVTQKFKSEGNNP